MKKYISKMWVSYVLALVIPYMLFIFEPIELISLNINDFWFDIYNIMSPTLLLFTVTLLNIIYFINKKGLMIFNAITFGCFLCTYIQGNYLVGHLPVLDGTPIEWQNYTADSIISIIMWLIVFITLIFICIKFKIEKVYNYFGYISLAIFIMLSVSLITTLTTTEVLKQKQVEVVSTSTVKNINKYSKDDNFIILLLDAVDSKSFANAMKLNPDLAQALKDFTYYPDTMSMHPFTQESIPLILSGVVYQNQSSYQDYYIDAMKNSSLLNKLYENDYEVNIYEPELSFNDKKALKIANVVNSSENGNLLMNKKEYIKEEIRYVLFRYSPFFLKKYSRIENLDFNDTRVVLEGEDGPYSWQNWHFLEYIDQDTKDSEKKNFKFFHLLGAHVPFDFNKNYEFINDGTYLDELECSLSIVNDYFKYLKENGYYDNSKIIVMADHGFAMDKTGAAIVEGRQNPILFIKGKNESHSKMNVSDKSISYIDLKDAYNDLIDNKKSTDLFSNITNKRTRKYLFYRYTEEDYMIEYETKDKAWETNKLHKTGNEYRR